MERTGVVPVANIEKLLALRLKMGDPYMRVSPLQPQTVQGLPGGEAQGDWVRGNISCSHGCNQHCNQMFTNVNDGFGLGKRQNRVEKCVGRYAIAF